MAAFCVLIVVFFFFFFFLGRGLLLLFLPLLLSPLIVTMDGWMTFRVNTQPPFLPDLSLNHSLLLHLLCFSLLLSSKLVTLVTIFYIFVWEALGFLCFGEGQG
jgi:hypothetical protein